jgi:uncharacterized protein (DUF2147 family)
VNTITTALSSLALAAALLAMPTAHAQGPATAPDATPAQSAAPFRALVGRWVRPDGGYVISIDGVGADGKLDAAYANPTALPFARAEASREGDQIKLFFELTAGGYGGSTYKLTLDPAGDTLRGVYYQANARQSYNIYFERKN